MDTHQLPSKPLSRRLANTLSAGEEISIVEITLSILSVLFDIDSNLLIREYREKHLAVLNGLPAITPEAGIEVVVSGPRRVVGQFWRDSPSFARLDDAILDRLFKPDARLTVGRVDVFHDIHFKSATTFTVRIHITRLCEPWLTILLRPICSFASIRDCKRGCSL